MRIAMFTIFLALLFGRLGAQANCDIATTGVAIVSNTTPPFNAVSVICTGQHAYFKFSIANLGSSPGCVIPAGSVNAIFSLPVTIGIPYGYVNVITPSSPYFSWTFNAGANVLIGTNTLPIPQGAGDANILVEVVGNVNGTASSSLNLTQNEGISDNTANNTGSAQLTIATIPTVPNQPDQSFCATSSFTMTQSTPPAGSGVWTLINGSAVITTPSSPTTTVTGVAPGASATVRWTVTNNGCSASDDVTVTNSNPPDLTCDVTSPLSAAFTATPAQAKDGYITINNVGTGATTGTVVFRMYKPNNFTMQVLPATTQVFPEEWDPLPIAVDNTDFTITETSQYFEISSNASVFMAPATSKKIGFKITANTGGGTNLGGIMTVSIFNGTGGASGCGDSENTNNQAIILFSVN